MRFSLKGPMEAYSEKPKSMGFDLDGDYVLYTDYVRLVEENVEIKKKIKRLEKQLRYFMNHLSLSDDELAMGEQVLSELDTDQS